MEGFITYKKFSSLENAFDLIEVLNENNIEYEKVVSAPVVDLTFGSGEDQSEVEIKIQEKDFLLINDLLEKAAAENLNAVDKNHYLYEFTDEELVEILEKPDEWSPTDYLISRKILAERGKQFSDEELQEFKKKRFLVFAEPEKGGEFETSLGYVLALLGGLLGIAIGWNLINSHKTLPNGKKVFIYNEQSRRNGKNILILGFLSLTVWILYYFRK